MKNIFFNKKRYSIQAIVDLRRHAECAPPHKVGTHTKIRLTNKGKKQAFKAGQKYPTDYFACFVSSEVTRCIQTAEFIRKGFLANGGRENARIKVCPAVGFWRFKKMQSIEDLAKRKNFDDWDLYCLWRDHKLPKKWVATLEETADKAVRAVMAIKNGLNSKPLLVVVISHDWTLAAVFEHLTGKKIARLPRFNQTIRIIFTKDERQILQYGAKRYDIKEKMVLRRA